jgi:hypothetical protein
MRSRRLSLHLHGCGIQPGAVAPLLATPAGAANCQLVGRWRIEVDIWDRDHLDLCGPATLTIIAQGGEIAFDALEASLEVEYARDSIGSRWAGCEEGDQLEGEGTAELNDGGTIEIEFANHNGDEAVLKAKRATSSIAC